jgi:hypothetical protein
MDKNMKPKTIAEVDTWATNRLALELLGHELVASDSHDEDGAMMTKNQEWYFVPLKDDPVMAGRGIAKGTVPTDKPRWAVETVHCYSGYPNEPDDYDLAEEGDRQDSLFQAIVEASRIQHEEKIRNVAEGIYWEGEGMKMEIDPQVFGEYEIPTKCPHGNEWHECGPCDHASDLAYDAARENRFL